MLTKIVNYYRSGNADQGNYFSKFLAKNLSIDQVQETTKDEEKSQGK